MAVYKVPQDVEAEDKLLGWLTFRQFIYFLIVLGAGFVAYLLSRVFIGLIIIPLPIILLFGVLILPLRRDQPMETYLLALIHFYFKPKQRLWNPDGTLTMVQITAPKQVEEVLAKDITEDEARSRLSRLAQIVDTRGWAAKGVVTTAPTQAVVDTVAAEAETISHDVFAEDTNLARSFDNLIAESDAKLRQQTLDRMHGTGGPQAGGGNSPHYNPYPNSMHQQVIQPLGHDQPAQPAYHPSSSTITAGSPSSRTIPAPTNQTAPAHQPTHPPAGGPMAMTADISPDIMRLANNNDLSISAIAHEAHRLELKQAGDDEVVISLR